jgi:hypothetical protein
MKSSLSGIRAISAALGFAAIATLAVGCNDQPTTVTVANDYPAPSAGAASAAGMTVFKVWWVTTLLPSPVAPGETSEAQRTIPGNDFAYALLAPGWSPDSGSRPERLVAVKSVQKLQGSVHDLLTIAVSDQQFTGNCAAGSLLDDLDAQLIVQSIFPGSFVGLRYEPATCSSLPTATDGGAPDAGDIGDAGQLTDATAD